MKALAIIFYALGVCLLVASCFTTGTELTWWLGGGAILVLIVGCVLQYNIKKREMNELINDERNAHF